MNVTENLFLYFDFYKFFVNYMIYELIATDIGIEICENKCENMGGILPQDFRILTIDDITISGTIFFWAKDNLNDLFKKSNEWILRWFILSYSTR